MSMPPEWPERFRSKVAVDLTGCWTWLASTTGHGYGRFGRGRRGEGWALAHRFGWELLFGPIPDGLELDHLCRNRACVNPDHLEPVTHAENIRRGDLGNGDGWCRSGRHRWVPENMLIERGGNGMHRCRECRNEWRRSRHSGRASSERTHCPQGHPYDETNTYVKPNGHRECRACHRERERRKRHKGANPLSSTPRSSTP